MATLTQRVTKLRDANGQYVTVDFVYDSVTFLVASVSCTNPWQVSFTYTVVTAALVSTSHTVTAGAVADSFSMVPVSLTLASTLELPGLWTFGGG